MSNSIFPNESLNQLKCANYKLYLSLGPVKCTSTSKENVCGRCSTSGIGSVIDVNNIYEEVVRLCLFPYI